MRTEEQVVYLTLDQASNLVDRISERAKNFDYIMDKNEKDAMANLLSDIGVKVSDIIDVSNLADNYAINAEIVTPLEAENYDRSTLDDALFNWYDDDGGKYYCLTW